MSRPLLSRREVLGGLVTLPARAAAPAKGTRYNVLFLMSDEHSPHAAGFLGSRIVKTPALDSLARSGTAFSAAYCQNPICVPSRASFVTGRMPSNVGVYGNDGGLDPKATTMADVFNAAGYKTAWFGKTHWGGNPRFQTGSGKNTQEAERRRGGKRVEIGRLPEEATVAPWPVTAEVDTITKEEAVEFLKQNRNQPFFAGVSFVKPHFPFIVQEQYYRMYKDVADAPRVTQKMLDELPAVSKQEREKYGFAKLTEAQIRKARAVYFGMVSYIDDLVGEILKTVDQLGLRNNTIILYTADHGELAGEHGLWYKNSFYEAAVSVPFVWSFPPAIPRGKMIHAPVMNMDIFPTLCELCGLPKPEGLEGRSLLPLMTGAEDGSRRYALSENYRNRSASRMIRTPQWKYCYFDQDREQLFDMRTDRAEEKNLAGRPEHRELVASLRARALEGWKKPAGGNRSRKKG